MTAVAESALGLVGETPLVRVSGLDTGPCQLWLKLESQNPGGSIKDRIAVSMIAAAEREGWLGGDRRHLVEATAGNTGLGLALVAARRGYRLTLVVPDKMSREKVLHLKALGAEVVTTRSDVVKGHPDYYQDLAERIAREGGAYYVNQFANPANPLAHETGTGPEIARQMEGRLDAMVCGVGSGGTLTGLSRFLARAIPECEMVLADPEGSVLAGYVRTGRIGVAGSWLVEGIGEDFLPPICDLSRVRQAYSVPDGESFQAARQLLLHTGVLAGSSSGTLLAAALRYCREQQTPKRVCTLVCDTGNKYLSKMYDQSWLEARGLAGAVPGAAADLLARPGRSGGSPWLRPGDTLREAALRLRRLGLSALPVAEGRRILGVVTESHVLDAVLGGGAALDRPASDVMAGAFATVSPRTPLRDLVPQLETRDVAIVVDGTELLGVLTRLDETLPKMQTVGRIDDLDEFIGSVPPVRQLLQFAVSPLFGQLLHGETSN